MPMQMPMDDQPNSMADEPTAEIEIRIPVSEARNETAQTLTDAAQAEAAPEEAASSETESETASSEVVTSEVALPVAQRAASKKMDRPFRVKLRGAVLVLVRLPNKRDVRAAFHQLSVTGGVVHIEKPLDEKLGVEMIFHIGGETIREKAQMLFPMWATQGWMQPFRFVDMSEANRASLDAHLKTFLGESAKGAPAGA
jgi:hypothetical protein